MQEEERLVVVFAFVVLGDPVLGGGRAEEIFEFFCFSEMDAGHARGVGDFDNEGAAQFRIALDHYDDAVIGDFAVEERNAADQGVRMFRLGDGKDAAAGDLLIAKSCFADRCRDVGEVREYLR